MLSAFKGVVATPSDTEHYTVERWAQNAEQRAAYVVFPSDAEDISLAIRFARSTGLPIAISGGRHNTGGASSSEGGLVIDMRNMNAVRLDKDNMIAYVQGGTRGWGLSEELSKYGVAAPQGICGGIGFVGATIGGGLGFNIGRGGLACDTIQSATMVLANGDVIQVNEQENPDLLWGIKGGGSNFGVVAELGVRVGNCPESWVTLEIIYLPELLEALVEAIGEWKAGQAPEETIFLTVALGPQDGKPYLILNGFGEFSMEEAERRWSRFINMEHAVKKLDYIPHERLVSHFDHLCNMHVNVTYGGAYFSSFDYSMVKEAYDKWLPITSKAPMSVLFFEFYHMGAVAKVPVDATAFPNRAADNIALMSIMGFSDDYLPQAKLDLESLQRIISVTASTHCKDSFGYINYANNQCIHQETDANARRAFGPNYPRLRELKRKYDPEKVFNKWFCIEPSSL